MFNSSFSAAVYISRIVVPSLRGEGGGKEGEAGKGKEGEGKRGERVFVIGEAGVEDELRAVGLEVVGGTDPALRRDITPSDYASIASSTPISQENGLIDPDVGIVLIGLDFHLNYLKLALAYHYIQTRKAVFLTTNGDTTLPSSGSLFPGAGACAAPLVAMLGRGPVESCGKPGKGMLEAIERAVLAGESGEGGGKAGGVGID